MAHTIETLAELFIGDRSVARTTEKQGRWLSDLIYRAIPDYRGGSIYTTNNLCITRPALGGRSTDFKIERCQQTA